MKILKVVTILVVACGLSVITVKSFSTTGNAAAKRAIETSHQEWGETLEGIVKSENTQLQYGQNGPSKHLVVVYTGRISPDPQERSVYLLVKDIPGPGTPINVWEKRSTGEFYIGREVINGYYVRPATPYDTGRDEKNRDALMGDVFVCAIIVLSIIWVRKVAISEG